MRRKHLVFALFLTVNFISAQSPAPPQAWLSTDNIMVRFTPTGIHADNTGGFVLNRPDKPPLNLLSHFTPWIAGLDPAGNLKMACEMDDPAYSDWKAGFQGIANSQKVWKVTNEHIAAHRADFQDNGIIDNPISEIYSWPARRNQFSLLYNGFEVPDGWHSNAGFSDKNENGVYEPDLGEYPRVKFYTMSNALFPAEMIFSAFYNDTTGVLSHGRSIHTHASLQAFTFDCQSREFAENSVFVIYTFNHQDEERIDSSFFGVYSDFEIGNPDDDYLGCLPSTRSVYAYNSDTLYDAVTGAHPPMLALNNFVGPLDTNGFGTILEKFMPVLRNNAPAAMREPQAPNEFYNYITGSWRDGTPLTYGGTGYNGIIRTSFAYPGHPADPNAWSELAAANPPGDRIAMTSFGPLTILPNAVNQLIFSLSASTASGPTAQLNQVKSFWEQQDMIVYEYDFPEQSIYELCAGSVETSAPEASEIVSFSPNPATTHINLHSSGAAISGVAIFDVSGKKVLEKTTGSANNQDFTLDTQRLLPGLYILQWILENGRHGAEKIVVAR